MDPKRLAEFEDKPLALAWVGSARRALAAGDELALAGLRVNFAWEAAPSREHAALLAHIAATFESIAGVLHDSAARWKGVSEDEARAIFGASVPPAYAIYGQHVFFTPSYCTFGPKCRAAMVVHEAVHVFDARSGEPEIHISEWDEPRFSRLLPAQAIHNPSAYASFAAQVHHGELEWPRASRFGAGNPAV